jgi:Protein of unknown function (DUF1214)
MERIAELGIGPGATFSFNAFTPKGRAAIEEIPPVNAFWSVTMYDKDSDLVDNPIDRYALGDRSDLEFGKDGSLTLYIQSDSPGKDKERNWLPAPPRDQFKVGATSVRAEEGSLRRYVGAAAGAPGEVIGARDGRMRSPFRSRPRDFSLTSGALFVLLLTAGAAWAQQTDPTALAKTTQNPVGDLVSLPFQLNYFSGEPLEDETLFNLNFQPVVPLKLTDEWNVIVRTIFPYLSIPASGAERVNGFGDIQQQIFLSPAKPGAVIWGLGPALTFPTATNDLAKTGDWTVGPTAVLLTMPGPWVLGVLVFQSWTVAGDDIGPNVSQFTLQPFINFNFPDGWSLTSAPLITANWSAPDGEQWTVPLGIGVGKVTAVGTRPVNLGLQYYRNVERPASTGENQLRIIINLLYPKAPRPQ